MQVWGIETQRVSECGNPGPPKKGGGMIEDIREIGRMYDESNKSAFAENLIKEINVPLKKSDAGKERYIIVLDFDTNRDFIEIGLKEISIVEEELKEKSEERKLIKLDEVIKDYVRDYLWVGNNPGNIPQDKLTTNNISYLLSESIPNLYKTLGEGNFKSVLKEVINKFFIKVNSAYFLNLNKLSDFKEVKAEINYLQIDDLKEFRKKINKLLFDYLKVKRNLTKKEIILFSVKINGKLPSEIPEYINYIESSILDEPFKRSGFDGICHVCGKEGIVTYDTTKLPAKFYITKQIIFSSELRGKDKDGGFSKNFTICKDCYRNIIIGTNFINNYLSSRLAGTSVWIIPSLLFHSDKQFNLREWTDFTKGRINSIRSFDGFIKFKDSIEEGIKDFIEFEENMENYSKITLLFYEKAQSSFKIRKVIKDIPSKRLKEIGITLNEIKNFGNEALGKEERGWFIGLDDIYYLFPIRTDRNKAIEIRKILDFYEDLLLKRMVNKKLLIKEFVDLFRIYHFENFSPFNIKTPKNPDISMIYSILKTNLLFKLLEKLNMIKGGKGMEENLELLEDEVKNYIKEMGYSEEESALFLLGYLIGDIGAEQVKEGGTSRAILNKITFRGISPKKLLILSNDIFEKLDQYNIRNYFTEKVFSVMKELMDKHIKNWSLDDEENVYYILSGYAYNTYKKMKYSRQRKEEKND